MDTNQYDSYFWLGVMANIAQLLNFDMNIREISNDEIMKNLQNQDKILDEQTKELQIQTNIYLKKIVEQNEYIIALLEKGNKAQ